MSEFTATAVLLGYVADRALGDPERHHPVAWFGTCAAALERRTYRNSRVAGLMHVGALLGVTLVGAHLVERAARRGGPIPAAVVTAVGVWTALGGTTLCRTGIEMADAVAGDQTGDLTAARAVLPALCGRDPFALSGSGLIRAATESVAENTSDATVGVVVWAAVFGLPGALGYRVVNTLDSMIGYRSPRYERFGWFAARLDDAVNYIPARLCGALTVVGAPLVGGSAGGALRSWRSDAAAHPSPNAGVAEASAAGALGVTLGGPTRYAHGLEIRPTLGAGPPPSERDLRRAVTLSSVVQALSVAVSAVGAIAIGQARSRLRRAGRTP